MFNLIKDDFDENMEDIMDSINKILNDSEKNNNIEECKKEL